MDVISLDVCLEIHGWMIFKYIYINIKTSAKSRHKFQIFSKTWNVAKPAVCQASHEGCLPNFGAIRDPHGMTNSDDFLVADFLSREMLTCFLYVCLSVCLFCLFFCVTV